MRQLRNTLLLYLAEVNTGADWFVEQYQLTDNMTDTLAVHRQRPGLNTRRQRICCNASTSVGRVKNW